jgi:hypothetical protein
MVGGAIAERRPLPLTVDIACDDVWPLQQAALDAGVDLGVLVAGIVHRAAREAEAAQAARDTREAPEEEA